jgi:caspase domain-containing protein
MLRPIRVAGCVLLCASLAAALLVLQPALYAGSSGAGSQDAAAQQASKTQVRVYARSDTHYMKSETIEEALRRQPEFSELNIKLTYYRTQSDFYVEIKRSLLTWEWSYTLVDSHNGRELHKGKLRAVTADGAANSLGPLIIRAIAFNLRRTPSASTTAAAPKRIEPPPPAVPAVPATVPTATGGPDAAALERELRAANVEVEDLDTPRATGAVNPHAYALILGAENYRAPIPQVPFALNDAAVMRRYFEGILGVAGAKIKGVPNPALSDFKVGLMWLRNQVLADGSPSAVAYVYYAGHGVPDAKNKPYLMPVDANPDYITETGYAVDTLVAELSRLPGHSVVFLDACFTGTAARASANSAGVTLGKRPAFVEVPLPTQTSRVSVFSAVTGHQTSNALRPAFHGLFTYYLLKGLRGDAADLEGRITLSSLNRYVTSQVSAAAARLNQAQTPTLSGPAELVLVKPRTTAPAK